MGSDPHVDGVDTDPCIDSDGNFGVGLSGLELQFSGTIHCKCDVGVQVGGEPFAKHLNLDCAAVESMRSGLVVRLRRLCSNV